MKTYRNYSPRRERPRTVARYDKYEVREYVDSEGRYYTVTAPGVPFIQYAIDDSYARLLDSSEVR